MHIEGDSSAAGPEVEVGTTVNHYRIVSWLGAGAMGEVFLAEDTGLERRVALKFLSLSYWKNAAAKELFTREAQAAASLKHPNIITIYEVSHFQGRPFFAMEYVDGTSLHKLISQGPIPLPRAVELVSGVCAGLATAHEQGLVHRDIKPGNVLVDSDGQAKLVDFGLARMVEESQADKSHLSAGTLAYMSPEQTRGEQLTPSSDLFSLGVTFYEMLTGRRPFTGDYEASLMYSIANDDPPAMTKAGIEVSQAIEDIVRGLLQKDPDNRPQNARRVQNALDAILKAPVEDNQWQKTKRHIFAGLTALLGAVIIVAAILIIDRSDFGTSPVKTVTVLPFDNLGAPEDDYFADGMTDAVTMHLAKFGQLRVISRASAMLYKDSEKSPQSIGAELGTAYLLTGTVLWEKDDSASRVRINTALVRTSDGANIWVNSYERVLDRIFAVQSDIARSVTGALNVAVLAAEREELDRVPTNNLEAYDLYLRGNEYFNRTWDREDIAIATQFYERAVAVDSSFADAYAMLSRGHASMYWEYFDRSQERRQRALWAARRSLEIEPDLVTGHLALGYCYYHCARDYRNALTEFELALRSQPNNADLYNAIAAVQRRQGDLESSARNFMKALELDPRSHLKAFDVGLTYGMMRQYDEAEAYLVRTIALAPDWPLPYVYRAWLPVIHDGDVEKSRRVIADALGKADLTGSKYYWWLRRIIDSDYNQILSEMRPGADTAAYFLQKAQLYRLMGNDSLKLAYADSARALLEERLHQQPEDAGFHSSLGLACADLGMKEKAMASGQRAVALLPTSKEAFDAPFYILTLAEIMVIFGEYDTAVEQLRYLLTIPGFISPSYLKLDPLWQPLRGRSDFESLLEQPA